jgi:hypothetical protein
MNRAEAAGVLRIVFGATNITVDDAKAEVWYRSALNHLDVTEATAIAYDLAASVDRLPTPAVFNELRRAKLQPARQNTRALPEPPADEYLGKAWLAAMRTDQEKIGKGSTGTHLHTEERWEQCGGCRETSKAVAMSAGEARRKDLEPEF